MAWSSSLGSFGFGAVRVHNLGLGGAIRDPRFLHSSDLPGSDSPANTTVSLLPAITLSPKFYVEITMICLKHPCAKLRPLLLASA